ncbi:HMP-PP phosphatase [bioreactor metagenome]|uniref:HMP-PP phosphatase n=1 Tax=bioreactor metagenome TaxID=1076179 RepID=A0A644YDT8_9ZZZZ|nr:Cof-type HAD-IIB family hydrolase [Candidatus Metalachnospira sp.]
MDYKMLFLDLDDTLLSSDLSISEENLNAIRRASEFGVKVVICTGRGIFSVKHIAEQFKIEWDNCYIICLNGGAVYKGYPPALIKERLFNSKSAALIYETAKKYGIDVQIYRDDKLILENISERVKMYIDKLNADFMLVERIMDYEGQIAKILLNGPNDVLLKVEKELKQGLKDKFNVFFSNPNYLEFTAIGTTKGEAMAQLAREIGISTDQTIAIGDSFNDISMIRAAGLGVAVRNAVDSLKVEANYITKNTHDESAVAEVINRYIFGEGTKNIYKFRFPILIFVILILIEQLLASAFNIGGLKILGYLYINAKDTVRFNVLSLIIPLMLCFVVDYFNQKTKGEDEEEFWVSKYGKK